MQNRLSRSHFETNDSPEESLKQLLNQIASNKLVQCRNCALLPTCNNPIKGFDEGCNKGSSLSFIAWSDAEIHRYLSLQKEELPLASDESKQTLLKP